MRKKGDIISWTSATVGILLLNLLPYLIHARVVQPDPAYRKFAFMFAFVSGGMYAGGMCFVGAGLFSAFARRKEPIVGSIIGIALYYPAYMCAYLGGELVAYATGFSGRLPLSIERALGPTYALLLPLALLSFAFLRQPKGKVKEDSNNASDATSEPAPSATSSAHQR